MTTRWQQKLITNLGVCVRVCVCFTAEAASSRMFEGFPDELFKALAQEPLTGNFHHYGVTVKVIPPHTHTHTSTISRNINTETNDLPDLFGKQGAAEFLFHLVHKRR